MTDNPYRPPQSEGMPSRPPISLHAARMAKMVFENLWEFHQPVHEYRMVDAREFRRVSRRFYRRTQAQFEALGFTLLGDIEDVTLNNSRLKPRTFIRTMVDPFGTSVVAFYHIKPVLWMRIAMLMLRMSPKVIEIESYASEGCMRCTTTAPKCAKFPCPASIEWERIPRRLGPARLYQWHVDQLSRQGVNPRLCRIRGVEDVIAMQQLQNRQRYEYLEEIGWATPEYLASQGVRADMVDDVYEEIQRLRAAAGPQDGWQQDGRGEDQEAERESPWGDSER